jgi:hypothetical protein
MNDDSIKKLSENLQSEKQDLNREERRYYYIRGKYKSRIKGDDVNCSLRKALEDKWKEVVERKDKIKELERMIDKLKQQGLIKMR